MPKHPESQALFTRLLTEAGFRNDDGTFDNKRFCKETGMKPGMMRQYIKGDSAISVKKIVELQSILKINIL